MAKSGTGGMALHQALSFSPVFLRIPRAEAVFWPGCALMTLEPRILAKTLAVLERAEPGIQLASGCCGQPTVYLFSEKAPARLEGLVSRLKKQGVRRIYTACPNCAFQLGQLEGFQIIPIWGVLAEHLTGEDLQRSQGRFVWHDPCPTKAHSEQRLAARKLLALSGCDVTEPENIRCCGNIQMLRARDPEKSAVLRQRRLAELASDRIILSSCEGCLDAFRSEGRETCHLLELLFGKSKSRGWHNRIRNTLKTPVKRELRKGISATPVMFSLTGK